MQKRITTRLCALCDRVIPDEHVVCKEHMSDYLQYRDEEWFKVLVLSQRRQFEIDIEESLIAEGIYKATKPYRKLSQNEKYSIRFLWNKGLGARNISKILGINYYTIRSYTRTLPRTKQAKDTI